MVKSKQTQGTVPRLRFPGFVRTSSPAPLSEVAEFINSKISADQIRAEQYVSTGNLLPGFAGWSPASNLPSISNITEFWPGDILISNIRPYLKKVWQADMRGGASNDVLVVRARETIQSDYLATILRSDLFIDYVMRGAKGVKMPRGDISMIREFPVPRPSAAEQQEIADCLSSLDACISEETCKLDALKAHKQGLMLQLFPGKGQRLPRLRFPGFGGKWKVEKVSRLVVRSVRPVDVEPDETYQEIGIRSHGKGIFYKDQIKGKALGSKRVFWITEDSLVLNIVFAWEQAVAATSSAEVGMIASHRFPMYQGIANKADVTFLKYFFLTGNGKELLGIASPGGAGRNKTLGQKELENLGLLVPESVEEQQQIAACLSSLDELIAAQSRKLAALQQHKKGLMQGLLPALDAHAA